MQNPTVMQMMMSRMPPHMRKPEVLKAMMANPEVRARMSALAQEKVRATQTEPMTALNPTFLCVSRHTLAAALES